MHKRIQFITHQKKQILLVNFSNCPSSEIDKIARAVPEHVSTQPRGSVLVLSDFTGATLEQEAIRTIKETAVFDKPYVKKSALVGGWNLPEVLGQKLKDFSRRELRTFNRREEALKCWLKSNRTRRRRLAVLKIATESRNLIWRDSPSSFPWPATAELSLLRVTATFGRWE